MMLQIINKVKVTHQGQNKNVYLLPILCKILLISTYLILCMWLEFINKVKVKYQVQGHFKVKVKYLHLFQFYEAHTVKQVGGFPFD